MHKHERPGGREGDERGRGGDEKNQLAPHTERVRGLQKEGGRAVESQILTLKESTEREEEREPHKGEASEKLQTGNPSKIFRERKR